MPVPVRLWFELHLIKIRLFMREIRNEYFYLTRHDVDTISTCEFNRNIVKKHVKKIKAALLKDSKSFYVAIIVVMHDGKMIIIDGNHRFTAVKELWEEGNYLDSKGNEIELRVQCINEKVDAEKLMVQLNNTSLKWGVMDFIRFNSHRGNPSCVRFNNFIDDHEIDTVSKALAYFGRGSLKKSELEYDTFPEISEAKLEGAELIFDVIETIRRHASAFVYDNLGLHNANGIRYFAKYLIENPHNVTPLIEYVCSSEINYIRKYRAGTVQHFNDFYNYLETLIF